MACGEGANIGYMSSKFPNCKFTGIELSNTLVEKGNEKLDKIYNCSIQQGDWYNLNCQLRGKFDGIISFQTLSWLPEYRNAIKCLTEMQPKWIAISSLFYEGNIDYTIKLDDYSRGGDHEEYYYNIYSLVQIKKMFYELGYNKFSYVPFNIDIDLPKPEKEGIGTYMVKTIDGKRIQISAGLMLPWYFIVAERENSYIK